MEIFRKIQNRKKLFDRMHSHEFNLRVLKMLEYKKLKNKNLKLKKNSEKKNKIQIFSLEGQFFRKMNEN